MAQTYPLDKVIRIVDPDYRVTSSDELLIAINPETNKAIEMIDLHGRTRLERGFLRRFRVRKYFLVSNNSDVQNEAEGPLLNFELRDFTHDWRLGLRLNYLASCSPGNEAKLTEALCTGLHPGAVLNDFLNRWLKEFAGANASELIENYYSRKDDLVAYLASQALDEIGLNLTASIQLEAESKAIEPIKIRSIHFPVRFKDYNDEQDLKLEAQIQVDPQRKIFAVLYLSRINGLEELIRKKTQEYFAATVSLHTFHAETAKSGLERDLKKYLDSFLTPFGRQLGFISLGSGGGGGEAFFEAKKKVEFNDIQEFDRPVEIKNTLQMFLRDYALYKTSGAKDLNLWIEENLTEVIREVLFGKRYIDLLIGFEPLEQEIKLKLSARAEAIGYTIRHLITVPDLPPYDWLENFDVEVENEYETKMPKFPVKLGVIVTARIVRLKDIESYLNRRQDVPKLMKDAIENEVRRFLHKVDPERFYMRFSYAEPEEEDPPIEQALRELIEARLVEKFQAEVIGTVFKMRDTEITQIWTSLEKSEGTLEIKLPSFSDVEGVTYRGRVRVEAIHGRGWNRFRTSNPEMEKICRRLEEHVLAQLGTFANADLVYTHLEGQRQVEKVIEGLAKKFAVEEFGLVIRVVSIRRDVTAIELDEKTRIRGILDAMKDLETERIAEIKAGATSETIKNIEERYQKLFAELPANVKTTTMKFTRPELIEPAPPTRLSDILTGRKALGIGSRPRHNNGHEGAE